MLKKQVAVIGYGNVGKFAVAAIKASPDLNLIGIVRPTGKIFGKEEKIDGIPVVGNIQELPETEGAVLAIPTRMVEEYTRACLTLGINTVDSFDLHGEALLNLRKKMNEKAKKQQKVAVLSAGWDPGTDSLLRGIMEMMAPRGVTFTNFGPGMSMGHTVAAKGIPGVKDALAMTIPLGAGFHRRLVYIELEAGKNFSEVKTAILQDEYFSKDETEIIEMNNISNLIDTGHGVLMERKGASANTDNQIFKYEMRVNNPALTAQIMVAGLRASFKLQPGAYTMLEIPILDFLPGDQENILKRLV